MLNLWDLLGVCLHTFKIRCKARTHICVSTLSSKRESMRSQEKIRTHCYQAKNDASRGDRAEPQIQFWPYYVTWSKISVLPLSMSSVHTHKYSVLGGGDTEKATECKTWFLFWVVHDYNGDRATQPWSLENLIKYSQARAWNAGELPEPCPLGREARLTACGEPEFHWGCV